MLRRTLCCGGSLVGLILGSAVWSTDPAQNEVRAIAADSGAKSLPLNLRFRKETASGSGRWHTLTAPAEWNPKKTAIVICDMWDKHWCKMATERVGQMAPRMNALVNAARQRGVFIIHCPSDTMDFYKDTPQRKLAQTAPVVAPKTELQRWCRIDLTKEAPLPIDDSDGGCDSLPQDPNSKAWSRQIATIEVANGDAITDSSEAYYLMRQRGIENVIVMGVHTNMCVLGRPFSIRQMVQQGLNVVLCRDLTDTMYNPRNSPFVSHFTGTDLVVEHIEKYWCPTITSGDLLDGREFRFPADKRPHVAIIVSEEEYETNQTLPKFAAKYLGKDFRVTFVFGGADATDNRNQGSGDRGQKSEVSGQKSEASETSHPQPNGVLLTNLTAPIENQESKIENSKNDLPGLDVLDHADVALISCRRRTLTPEQLDRIKRFVSAGKPMVGIRTSSHPFHLRDTAPPEGRADWKTFDSDVWGGHYTNHYGNAKDGPNAIASIVPGAELHPILTGFPSGDYSSGGTLYMTSPLADGTKLLVTGRFGDKPHEPVAWTFTRKDGGRSFYTSLGHKSDFAQPEFCRLLMNSLLWAADLPVPKEFEAVKSVEDFQTSWNKLTVPGTWDDQSKGVLSSFDGIAWYRAEVKIPAEWNTAQVTLATEQIDNAHEAYFNGAKLGGAGAFPPSYASGLTELKRFAIPSEHIRFGEANVVAIRIYDHDGKGGFKGAAPSVSAGGQTIRMEGPWDFKVAALKSEIRYPKSDIANEELTLFAARVDDTNRVKLPANSANFSKVLASPHSAPAGKAPTDYTPILNQADALKTLVVPDDLKVESLLAEPLVKQPLYMTWDERGRLWVVQYIQYPYPAGLKMLSRDAFLRAVYDKVPPPPPQGEPGLDKITIHEDTDGDGVYDKHKTFLEGSNITTSCALDRDGVWVMNPPYLLFYPDKNHDDVPDGRPEVHLQGFGLEDTHSVANSLRWGPDGWLYACQGSTTSSAVVRPGLDKQPVHSMGQLIWRYHPPTRRFEIFAEGGGNSFGCEINAEGRVFSGHNGGDTRGFHYVQGGYFQKGFNKHGPLSNPFAYGYFAWMTHHSVPRFTHNFIIDAGASLPDKYRGHLFGVEPLQGRVVEADFKDDRSSFQTKDLGHVITSTDKRFRPVDIKAGPDGAIYVADMYEPQIAHHQHFQGLIDKDNGRIYRLSAKDAPKDVHKPFDYGKKSSVELIEILKHPNKWHRQTALRLLGQRRDTSVIPLLRKNLEANKGQFALECLWALYQVGGLDESFVPTCLSHTEPLVREWTVRLLGDMSLSVAIQPEIDKGRHGAGAEVGNHEPEAKRQIGNPKSEIRNLADAHLVGHRSSETRIADAHAHKLIDVAKSETYVRVRSQLAATAKRLPADQALPVINALLTHNEDADDIHIPLLLWWALESKASKNAHEIVGLFKNADVWKRPLAEKYLVSRVMQRFAQSSTRNDLMICAQLLAQAPTAEHKKELLKGFETAFKGRPLSGLPDELVAQITSAGGGSLALRVRQKDAAAIDEALRTVVMEPTGTPTKPDEKAAAAEARARRVELIQTLGEVQPSGSLSVLIGLLKSPADDEIRSAILTSLLSFKDESIGADVVAAFDSFSADVQSVALTLLSSRAAWARQLLEAVEAGRIKNEIVPMDVARKLTFFRDARVAELLKKHWPKLEGTSTVEMQQQLEKFSPLAKAEGGVPFEGKKIYMQSCGKCHLLFGEGGRIGPDLTTFKRDDVMPILLNVVNPSAEIREGFESITVVTSDGRTVTGFLADQDNRVVVVRGIDGQNITINRDDIDETVPQKKSLMPEGLLNNLTEEQVRNLFAYLRISQPLNQ